MMRAAVITEPENVQIEQVPTPKPSKDQVLVRLEGCGMCASNLPLWRGRNWFEYPLAPGQGGHEAWGRVEALGPDVDSVAVGDRVAMLSDRAYAEYDVAQQESVVRLPAVLEGKPFPGEPLGCAMNIFARSDIRKGQNVAIIGIGFLGAVLTRLSANAGARVIAISRRPSALKVARDFGAGETIPMDEYREIINRVMRLTNENGCERVIEAVGLQWPLELAGELTAVRGRLVIAGYHQDGPRQVDMQLWNWRGLDVVNAHERDPRVYVRGICDAVAAVESGSLDPLPLYSMFPLERIGDAFEAVDARPDGFVKALVIM